MSKTDINVNVWINSQEMQKGSLGLRNSDVIISLDSGDVLSSNDTSNASYSVVDDSRIDNCRIRLSPVMISTHFYAADIGQVTEDIFPPSSGGFYGRLRAGKDKARYIVQKILNDPRLFLIVGDPHSGRIFETQVIHPYEAETLSLYDNVEISNLWDRHLWSGKEEHLKREIDSVLGESSPSWDVISKLTMDASMTDLKRGGTFRETLSQLVPDSFSNPVRDQLLAFLALILTDKIREDDFLNPSSFIYAAPMLSPLLQGHLRCKFDKLKWPPYLKLIRQYSEGRLEQPRRSLPELTLSSERFLIQKIIELLPNWFGAAIISAQELNQSKTFRPRLPVTKSQALRSRKHRKKRLAAITYGLRLRGHVNHHRIGLTEIIYLGAAYRWPHRHMNFITRLGLVSENPPHLQTMIVPPASVERVGRALPQSTKITWSTRVVNLNLYDDVSEKWKIPVDDIESSLYKSGSKRKLTKKYGVGASRQDTYQIDDDEAIVLGLASRGIYLEDFEHPGYFEYWNLDRNQVTSIVRRLTKNGVLQINYDVDDSRLVSIVSIVQGKSANVTSFVYSLLMNSPTSFVFLNDQFNKGIVISRFPDDIVFNLATRLNQLGNQQNLMIRCLRPRSFRSFAPTLYSRLLKPDGTWDDDVSAFLSQARSKRKELSESNA